MALFIRVSEGETADAADDLYLIDDPEVVQALGTLIAKRLGGRPLTAPAPQPLRPVRPPGGPEGEP
jgi:hypothetical protein